jgi:fermentation-respiration switch protein FrsA (DUF1100 family)
VSVAPAGGRGSALALGALLLAGCAMWIDAFVFFPDRQVGPAPPGVEELWIRTEDGVRLHAWYAAAREAGPVLLWSHGNAGNIDSRQAVLRSLAARGLGVLAYDYRGYGRSEGSPSEAGVYRDAAAVFDALVARGTDPGRIVCFGESLGGAVSIEVATHRRCGAIVTVAAFTRLADVARRHYGPLGRLAGDRFDSLARIPRVGTPVLVAHGDRDEIVPFELGERLFAAASSPKRFFRIDGADHNDALGRAALLDAVAEFARAAVSGRLSG